MFYRILWLFGSWDKSQEIELNGEKVAGEWSDWAYVFPADKADLEQRYASGPTRIEFRERF